ncbi:Isocitrate/isopropylmalate dehydrogenase family protein [archaeon GW2011_AR15]|nr:Isocitrate/isopropylmalate dehydrogenase family protein [archaeon GW2011_AR15]MBS3103374.1 isocitrate/isopropylmalate dehydrogenase family protein [Candidatus Woesearchaeota archaeon]
MKYRICVLPGDGIGPEVVEQAVKVLKALPLELEFTYGEIGYGCYLKKGDALPEETIKKVEKADATLFGAVTTPPNIENYSSAILRLRQHFDLYANLRPCRSFPHEISQKGISMYIVRENTEDLYSGVERVEDNGNKAVTEMIITRKGSERIIRYAFELAREKNLRKVTVVHKANVLRETCGLFRKVALEIAKEYPAIEMQEMLVDACAMQLIKNPGQFEIIVTTNMFGDILSDEASMLVGGLGLAYSGNIGKEKAVFEPVHGSAPKYAGKNVANPAAAILAAKLMLEFLGEDEAAKKVGDAVMSAIEEGDVTQDLGGKLTTEQAGDAVARRIK